MVPDEHRGSNFALKVDDRSLPAGYRLSTDQMQVKRATRGKTLNFVFGASIHRVVALDLADAVFQPHTTEIRPQWLPRFDLLLEELTKAPSVLRLSYLADTEPKPLVRARLKVLKRRIAQGWAALDCCYHLEIEPPVFWRLGEPAEDAVKRAERRMARQEQ